MEENCFVNFARHEHDYIVVTRFAIVRRESDEYTE